MQKQINLILSLVMTAMVAFFGMSQTVLAITYGDGSYGQNQYSTDPSQSTTTSSTQQTIPPETTPVVTEPNTLLRITIDNIGSNKPVDAVIFDVNISLDRINTETNQPVALGSIGWVSLYANNILVGSDYTITEQGKATVTWDLSKYPADTITVIVFSNSGQQLGRYKTAVTYATGIKEKAQQIATQSSDVTKQNSPGLLKDIMTYLPLVLFILLCLMSVWLLWRASRDRSVTEQSKEQLVANDVLIKQKTSSILLTLNYLNTPYARIYSAVNMFNQADGITSEPLKKLQNAVKQLQATLANLSTYAKQQSNLASQTVSTEPTYTDEPAYKSALFYVPFTAASVVLAVTMLALQIFYSGSVSTISLVGQIIVLIIVGGFLLLSVKRFSLRHGEMQTTQNALLQQQTLGATTDKFINDAAGLLKSDVGMLVEATLFVQNTSNYTYLDQAIKSFKSGIDAFELVDNPNNNTATQQTTQVVGGGSLSGAQV